MRNVQKNSELSKQQLENEIRRVQHRRRRCKAVKRTAIVILVMAAMAVLAAILWFPVLRIRDNAMKPFLEDDQVVMAVQTQQLQPGDIIAFKDGDQVYVKRTAACAGDVVEIDQSGNVVINGERRNGDLTEEAILKEEGRTYPYLVPKGRVFLMNDNMSASETMDSWNCGSIEISQVVGKVLFRIWPLDELKYLGSD